MNLPQKFEMRMKALLGERYPLYAEAMERPAVRALRANPFKTDRERLAALLPFETERLDFSPDGVLFSYDGVGNLPLHHAGAFYVQEPSAMFPVAAVPRDVSFSLILDLCAAPGGKTAQAAARLSDSGVIVSNEIVPSRMKILASNIERMGIPNAVVTCADTGRIASLFDGVFDLVIADVPCSGEGMFRKNPDAAAQWSEENVALCAERGASILDDAAACTAEGGYLLFSTCTFSLEENEKQVSAFLDRHPEFELCPFSEEAVKATLPGIDVDGRDMSLARRFYPFISQGEGQFAALLRKCCGRTGSFCYTDCLTAPPANVKSAAESFLCENLIGGRYELRMYKDSVVIPPPAFPIPKGAFACGVTVGAVTGKVLKPHHQLFSCKGREFVRQIELASSDPSTAKYLSGEGFYTDSPDGWTAVLTDGCPLGGGKTVSGYLKNHYPKGLRSL